MAKWIARSAVNSVSPAKLALELTEPIVKIFR